MFPALGFIIIIIIIIIIFDLSEVLTELEITQRVCVIVAGWRMQCCVVVM